MSVERPRVSRLLGLVGLNRAGDNLEPPNPTSDLLETEANQAIAVEQATELWDTGHRISAFNVLRQARLAYGPSAELQYLYGSWAFAQGNTWAAREAFHDAVELDPTHLDALEMFLETNRLVPGARGTTTEAISTLARLLPYRSGFDADAAALLLPSMSAVEVVDEKIRMLRYSENAVAKRIGFLSVERSDDWAST